MNRLLCNEYQPSKKFDNALSSGAPPVRHRSIPSSIILKKPSRPLTAFHIFSQLEKEFIKQRPGGDCEEVVNLTDDTQTINSSFPQRYQGLDIPHDWCESPGKRRKRKHRKTSKSSRRIDFVKMSRMIAARWAELSKVDMETKLFCQKVAEQKLVEYCEDLKNYKAALEARASAFSDEEETPNKDHLHTELNQGEHDGKYLALSDESTCSHERGYSSPYPVKGYNPNHSTDLDRLFKKNDIEINQCVKFFKRMSSSPQRTLHAIRSPERHSRRAVVSPSNFFTESEVPTFGTGRYGLVDMDDDEIIALFTGKKTSKQGSRCVDKSATDFISVCQQCS